MYSMNVTNIKGQIKKTFLKGAKKFLSPELREEFGVDQTTYADKGSSYDDTLNSFWDPVQTNNLTKRDTRKIAFWGIFAIVTLSIMLMALFFVLISPAQQHSKIDENTTLVVNGENVENKIIEHNEEDLEVEKDPVKVENIKTEDSAEEEDAAIKESPLLKSQDAANVAEYHLQYGDTLETVCTKFYGSYSYEKIQKLKTANNIVNPRSLQIGQKLIIPF